MNRITIETPHGTTLEYQHYDGICYPSKRVEKLPSKDMCEHFTAMKNLEIRDDDIYLATYEKAGTHWAWEILMMLKKGSVEYETQPKEYVFLDFRSPEQLANVPSPRIVNSHFPVKHTPKGIFEKKNKIVHVQRNPKDIFVSLYHHVLNIPGSSECESFSRFLPLPMGTYGIYHCYPWFKYVKEWERFTKENPDQILNIYYEDLNEDPVREIKKMDTFLQCGRSDELIQQIAEACSFQNLKKANDEVKDFSSIGDKKKGGQMMYRKERMNPQEVLLYQRQAPFYSRSCRASNLRLVNVSCVTQVEGILRLLVAVTELQQIFKQLQTPLLLNRCCDG